MIDAESQDWPSAVKFRWSFTRFSRNFWTVMVQPLLEPTVFIWRDRKVASVLRCGAAYQRNASGG